ASAIEGIIAQRLTRRICVGCKEPVEPDPVVLAKLGKYFSEPGIGQVFEGKGCSLCHGNGYKGRLGLYEVLVPDEKLRDMIASHASTLEMAEYTRGLGMKTLIEDARQKVEAGLTTLEEVLRVLGPQL